MTGSFVRGSEVFVADEGWSRELPCCLPEGIVVNGGETVRCLVNGGGLGMSLNICPLLLTYPKAVYFQESECSSVSITQFRAISDFTGIDKLILLYFFLVILRAWLCVAFLLLKSRDMFE
jgi:hypothetical protein